MRGMRSILLAIRNSVVACKTQRRMSNDEKKESDKERMQERKKNSEPALSI